MKREKPDVLKQRAETLKALFDAVLSIVTAVGKLQEFEKAGTLGIGGSSAEDEIKKMLNQATNIVGGTEISDLVDKSITLMEKVKDPAGLKAKAESMTSIVRIRNCSCGGIADRPAV